MGGCRLCAFDLDKTFCADCLIAAPRVIDVGGIVLDVLRNGAVARKQQREMADQETDGAFDGATIDRSLWTGLDPGASP